MCRPTPTIDVAYVELRRKVTVALNILQIIRLYLVCLNFAQLFLP